MATEGLLKAAADERKFLHDMASPLATVIFIIDSMLSVAKANAEADPKGVVRLEKTAQALDRMKVMLQDRRQVLIQAMASAEAAAPAAPAPAGGEGEGQDPKAA